MSDAAPDHRWALAFVAGVALGGLLVATGMRKKQRNDTDSILYHMRDQRIKRTLTPLAKGSGQPKRSVTVHVPATSANIGSGYDCVGMALDMWNELTLSRANETTITVEGEGADDIPLDDSNLVVVGVKAAFKAVGKELPHLKYELRQRIPHGRGLGSSSAAIIAGLLAGLAITGEKLDITGKEELLQLATDIEGHPDNVAPALYGGIQLGLYSGSHDRWMTKRVPVPHGLIFVIFIPTFTGKTSELREVVPKTVDLKDAVFNMGRLAWLVGSLVSGDTTDLREGFDDRLHQPYRGKAVYKHLYPVMKAAYDAGAIGAYLSGAGPSVMAITSGGKGDFFTQADHHARADAAVAQAMQQVSKSMDIPGKVYITHPSSTGAVVVKADPPYSTPLVMYNGET